MTSELQPEPRLSAAEPLPSGPAHGRKRSCLTAASFGMLVAFPSTAFLQEHAGGIGCFLYVVLTCGAFIALHAWLPRYEVLIERHFRFLCGVFFVGLLACYVGLHWIEDGKGPGKSSDRDEGLEMAVSRLIEGKNPYYPSNHIAGPLSVLPGGILLAAPFVILGSVGLQNAFWLMVFLAVAANQLRSRVHALAVLVLTMAISPAVQYEYVSGGDLISNGIYVAVFLWFAIKAWDTSEWNPAWAVTSAIFLGVGLASRANFVLLLPIFSAWIWTNRGRTRGIAAGLLAGGAFIAVTLPFYLVDPPAFTPLMSRGKISLPQGPSWTATAIVAATAFTSFAASIWFLGQSRRPVRSMFQACTLVTILPMALSVLLLSHWSGRINFSFMHDRFGLLYLSLALLGFAGRSKLANHEPDRGDARNHS